MRCLAEGSSVERWADDAVIVQQGDRSFVALDGRADVSVDGAAVGDIRPGDQFGEIALLHDVPRTETVKAAGPCTTLSLPREVFSPAVQARMVRC